MHFSSRDAQSYLDVGPGASCHALEKLDGLRRRKVSNAAAQPKDHQAIIWESPPALRDT